MTNTDPDPCAIARRSIAIMATGSLADFEEVVHPAARNREDVDEPSASRGRGPAAFYATALRLRETFADLRWEEHDVVQDGDLVVMHEPGRPRYRRPARLDATLAPLPCADDHRDPPDG